MTHSPDQAVAMLGTQHGFQGCSELEILPNKKSRNLSGCFCPSYLYHIDEDVDGCVDGEHQVVTLGQDLGPGRPE